MAIASCSVKIISRGKGRSAVAAAAYRAGQEMQNASDGLSHNYIRRSGIVYSDILTPVGAPSWAHDRQQLWNMVEQTERRKDAQLAREVMIALPRELSTIQNIELARDYAQRFVEPGMIADVSVHDSRDGNPHAHIMLTLRPLEGDSFGKKCREWNATEKLIEWREQYADLTNRYLERLGHDERIDARSYEAQGIDLIPTVHLGPHAHRMEQRGIPTERGDINREIEKDNQQLREIVKEIALLELEREQAQGQEPSAPQAPTDEPSPQQRLSFDEIYEVPTSPPQPHPEQPRPQERSVPPNAPHRCGGSMKNGILPESGCVKVRRVKGCFPVVPSRGKRNSSKNLSMTGRTTNRRYLKNRSRRLRVMHPHIERFGNRISIGCTMNHLVGATSIGGMTRTILIMNVKNRRGTCRTQANMGIWDRNILRANEK